MLKYTVKKIDPMYTEVVLTAKLFCQVLIFLYTEFVILPS